MHKNTFAVVGLVTALVIGGAVGAVYWQWRADRMMEVRPFSTHLCYTFRLRDPFRAGYEKDAAWLAGKSDDERWSIAVGEGGRDNFGDDFDIREYAGGRAARQDAAADVWLAQRAALQARADAAPQDTAALAALTLHYHEGTRLRHARMPPDCDARARELQARLALLDPAAAAVLDQRRQLFSHRWW